MKLNFVICNFEKYLRVNEITFNAIKKLALDAGFECELSCISQNRYASKREVEMAKHNYPKVNFYVYDNNTTENQCIYDALAKVQADRYFVCDARYTEQLDLIKLMLEQATMYGVHFVRCKKDYNGAFAYPVKYVKKFNNKLLGNVSSAKMSPYIRNLVIFDDVVYDYMSRSPINSGRVRETDMLVNTYDALITLPENFKRAKHFMANWTSCLIACASLFLSIWTLIYMFLVSTSFNTTTWCLMGFIGFGVIGFVMLLTSIASSRTLFYKPFEKKRNAKPVFELTKLNNDENKK